MLKELKVMEEVVLKAMAFCPEAKRVLEILFGDQLTPKNEEIYHVGQRFLSPRREEYILAQLDMDSVGLICLEDGNHWSSAVKISLSSRITEKEFAKICNYSLFTKKVER